MSSRPTWLVQRRALISGVCAIAVLSGLALILSQGRSGSPYLTIAFVVTIIAALVLVLQGITHLAQRSMSPLDTPRSTRTQQTQHESRTREQRRRSAHSHNQD